MGEPRVVITGIGVVSPFGVGRERFWRCISAGCSGTRAITDFDVSMLGCRVAAPVSGVTIDDVPEPTPGPGEALVRGMGFKIRDRAMTLSTVGPVHD